MSENKSFGIALAIWLFFAGIGAHRVYVQEKATVFLWYWLVTIITLGIFPLVDVFLLKGLVDKANGKYDKV